MRYLVSNWKRITIWLLQKEYPQSKVNSSRRKIVFFSLKKKSLREKFATRSFDHITHIFKFDNTLKRKGVNQLFYNRTQKRLTYPFSAIHVSSKPSNPPNRKRATKVSERRSSHTHRARLYDENSGADDR